MKSLINISTDIAEKMGMLKELMTIEFDSEEEREIFAREIVQSIVGDEKTMVHKVQNIKAFMDRIKDDIDRAKEWKADISRQIDIADNMIDRIKKYALITLKSVCAVTGGKSIEDGDVRIAWQYHGAKERLEIIDETMIPNKYFTHDISFTIDDEVKESVLAKLKDMNIMPYSVTKSPDKKAILAAINSGEKIDGVNKLPQNEIITIKTILPKE